MADAESGGGAAAAAAKASRENFLKRLESQQRQKTEEGGGGQLKSPPEGDDTRARAAPSTSASGGDRTLLLNYLSKFCDGPSSSAPSPAEWIDDVEPSSLAYLRELADADAAAGGTAGVGVAPPPPAASAAKKALDFPLLLWESLPVKSDDVPAEKPSSSAEASTEARLLELAERQQSQMEEMRRRIEELGAALEGVGRDVRYLRERAGGGAASGGPAPQPAPAFGDGRAGEGRGPVGTPLRGYRIMGGLLGGAGAPPLGTPGARAPGDQPPLPPGPPPGPPASPDRARRGGAAPAVPARAGARAAPPPPAAVDPPGMFLFPSLAFLFRLVLSVPGRVRAALLSTGVGRVYAHLRDRAIARDAFANVDLGSIVKLLVMLFIFVGRVGQDGGQGNAVGRRGRHGNNRQRRDEEADGEEEDAALAYVRALATWWRGHRVHTLFVASLLAFLIQTGLMGFLHEVLWVERGDLARAWLGQGEEGGGGANEGDDDDDVPARAPDEGGVWPAGDEGDQAPAAAIAAAPPVVGGNRPRGRRRGGLGGDGGGGRGFGEFIGRGPENGGFLHDVRCLVLSFVLSLVPAWRPEAAAAAAPETGGQDAPEAGPQERGLPAELAAGGDGEEEEGAEG
ncbi:hypothetical protein ACHAWF_002177 [Thalassiosira exigua]